MERPHETGDGLLRGSPRLRARRVAAAASEERTLTAPALADLLRLVPASPGDLGDGEEGGAWLLDGR